MSRYLVIGGTGTLGTETIRRLIQEDGSEVVCFSGRDQNQSVLRERLGYPKNLALSLGDIRDPASLARACAGMDVVFHFSALKHVDRGEDDVEEYAHTNLIGTFNVGNVAIGTGVRYVVFSSTDKAVDPVNAYGGTKLVAEKFLYSKNRCQYLTRFSVFRWGNVLGSQGSVIPKFVEQILKTGSYDLTHPDMTRFWIPISEAVDFMLANYTKAPLDRALIPPVRAAHVSRVAEIIADILGAKAPTPRVCGLRPGEKLHEVLSSAHTPLPVISSNDPGRQMKDEELRSLLKPIVEAVACK